MTIRNGSIIAMTALSKAILINEYTKDKMVFKKSCSLLQSRDYRIVIIVVE